MVGIREASERTGLTAHTLRYYERIGLVPDVPRDERGQRLYGEQEIRWITFLTKLRLTGMPIQQMQQYAALVLAGEASVDARRELLEAHRAEVVARLEELQENLAVLDYKINLYRSGCALPPVPTEVTTSPETT